MKFLRSGLTPVVILCALVSLQACKAKKLPQKPAQPQQTNNTPPPPVQQPKPQPVAASAPPPPPAPKPDYNFSNIQFEFNSSVLKTYLVNSGVSSSQLTAKGFGTTNPVGDNSTEAGRILNRRVEIHKL